jgi:hypothetical protein
LHRARIPPVLLSDRLRLTGCVLFNKWQYGNPVFFLRDPPLFGF